VLKTLKNLIGAVRGGGDATARPSTSAPAPSAVHRTKGPLETEEDVLPYKHTPAGELMLHVVSPRSGFTPAAGRPCVVFFHGGGWRRGSARQFLPFATLMAQRGLVGISAEYRLIEDELNAIPVEGIADARSAALGIDPARIAAGGGSAGAHLALMTALGDASLDDPADDRTVSAMPQALLLLNAPFDFDAYESQVPLEERRRYSPQHLLTAALPPALLMHGTRDKVIPFAQVPAFEAKTKQVGAPAVRVVPFEGRGHGFFNRGKGEPGDTLLVAKEMIGFLRQLGWET
jgi:acetyl esterase/lipase